MLLTIVSAMFGLAFKHFLFDYPLQTKSEVAHKGLYGDPKGMTHSLKHGAGTFLVFLIFTTPVVALAVAAIDFLTHYHIDWLKVQLTNKTAPNSKEYWSLFGADQLAHTIVYLCIILYVFSI